MHRGAVDQGSVVHARDTAAPAVGGSGLGGSAGSGIGSHMRVTRLRAWVSGHGAGH